MSTTIAKIYESLGGGVPTTWLNATGTVATSGDNTLIAAPGAGQRIVLAQLHLQLEAATSTTILIKHGATVVSRLLFDFKGDGLRENYPAGMEVVLPENTAFVVNLSGSNATGWGVRYRVEATS
jgi:hypothetical protein